MTLLLLLLLLHTHSHTHTDAHSGLHILHTLKRVLVLSRLLLTQRNSVSLRVTVSVPPGKNRLAVSFVFVWGLCSEGVWEVLSKLTADYYKACTQDKCTSLSFLVPLLECFQHN